MCSLIFLKMRRFCVFWRIIQKDRKSTRLNSSHSQISYAVFCLKKKKKSFLRRTCIRPHPESGVLAVLDFDRGIVVAATDSFARIEVAVVRARVPYTGTEGGAQL